MLDHFVDAGGSWIDTANCYAYWEDPSGFGGQSEELLGRWLARRPRDARPHQAEYEGRQ